jgi:hypothetical protein
VTIRSQESREIAADIVEKYFWKKEHEHSEDGCWRDLYRQWGSPRRRAIEAASCVRNYHYHIDTLLKTTNEMVWGNTHRTELFPTNRKLHEVSPYLGSEVRL